MQTTQITFTGETVRTRHRFRMARRSTFKHQFILVDADGVPIDLTGAVITLGVKATPEQDSFLIRKAITDPLPSTFVYGTFVMQLDPADTTMINSGWFVFGISMVFDGNTFELLGGDLMVYEGIATAPVN